MTRFPGSGRRDARLLVSARTIRGFVDGLVSVILADYLTRLGYSPVEISAIVTSTLLGSAALTLWVGLGGNRMGRRVLLGAASLLMLGTGIGFAEITAFWPLLWVAFLGTLNPSSGDVSVFLPTEQGILPATVAAPERTRLFAWYNMAGALAGALGAAGSWVQGAIAKRRGQSLLALERFDFVLYAGAAFLVGTLYLFLTPSVEESRGRGPVAPLAQSRKLVLRLSGLFCLDSFGGGFIVQSLLALWLFRRFHLDVGTAGAVFFALGLLSAVSQLASPWLARRYGLIPTMVFTHLPSNALLVLAALMPTAPLAILCLALRSLLSQMDVPARQSYVMAVVPPEERAAAASLTNVPRSLAAALSPLLGGALLEGSSFGWPLLLGGILKSLYDLLLLFLFRGVKPPEERPA